MLQHDPAANYAGKPRTCGFRLSVFDVIVLIAGAAAGFLLWPLIAQWSLMIPYVVGHFFLFCNVFRIRRVPELIWAGSFLLNAAGWIVLGHPNAGGILFMQLAVTLPVIVNEVRKPYYHGIFARRINSRIDDYLAGRV